MSFQQVDKESIHARITICSEVCGICVSQLFMWSKQLELRFPVHVFNAKEVKEKNKIEVVLQQQEYTSLYNASGNTRYVHRKVKGHWQTMHTPDGQRGHSSRRIDKKMQAM